MRRSSASHRRVAGGTVAGRLSGGDHPIAAAALGPVERAIGLGDELRDRLVDLAGDGDTDRDADASDTELAEVERPDRGPDALPDLEGDLGRRVAEEDHELLAAVAGRHVVLADGRHDGPTDRPQHLVAGRVAERVVEAL